MLKLRFLLSLALSAVVIPVIADATTPASVQLESGPDRFAYGAARAVSSILTYSRWPARSDPLRLCIVGSARHAGRLGMVSLPGGGRVERRDMPAASPNLGAACDAVYIGDLALPAMRHVTAQVRGRPVVTIAENDPPCRSEAMFCLVFEATRLSFQMNVDAISRSSVRIDPRVLRMSRDY